MQSILLEFVAAPILAFLIYAWFTRHDRDR